MESQLNVEILSESKDMETALTFCAKRYDHTYGSYWRDAPDLLFVAKSQDKVVATLGLELGQACRTFGAERYFCLSPRMKEFITDHRLQMGELGRFSSLFHQGARAVFQAAIGYAYENKIEYFIAWANPQVIDHMRNVLGIPFWALEVPINAKAVESDDQWVCPPRNFFFRNPPPRLLLSVVPFWELVHRHLSIETSLKENI